MMSDSPKIKPVILYVDNEVHNLISFIATFRRDYRIISVSSAKEAMAILEKELVEIIICNQSICQMSGVDFLASTMQEHSCCTRLLVSDYINLDTENKAQIFSYLIKPWDQSEIDRILKNAHEFFLLRDSITKNFW